MHVAKLMQMEDNALEELAVEEILKDLKRGAERAKEHGALGWQKNPAPPPNKRFLRNMLVSTLRDDRPLNFRRKFEKYSAKYKASSRDYYDFKLAQKDKLERREMYSSEDDDTGRSISRSRHKSRYADKRGREFSSDSEDDRRKNGETRSAKTKRHKKHHRRTPRKDGEDSGQRKHKKSKKSKKHKSKKSSHRDDRARDKS